jgi:hypothetical protein
MHEAKLAKMEAEMKMVFQQKVQEKEAKLKQSEEELYARHKEMKEALDKQRADLEEKRRRIESGRPLTPEKASVSFLDPSLQSIYINKFSRRAGKRASFAPDSTIVVFLLTISSTLLVLSYRLVYSTLHFIDKLSCQRIFDALVVFLSLFYMDSLFTVLTMFLGSYILTIDGLYPRDPPILLLQLSVMADIQAVVSALDVFSRAPDKGHVGISHQL